MVFVKLIFILRNIKKTLSAKGEIYKTVKINDSQINSMINWFKNNFENSFLFFI